MPVYNDSSALLNDREHFAETKQAVHVGAAIPEQLVVQLEEALDTFSGRITSRSHRDDSRAQRLDLPSLPLQLSGVRETAHSCECAEEEKKRRVAADALVQRLNRRVVGCCHRRG